MYAMDSLIRTCIWVVLVTGILGRSLLNEIDTSNSTDGYVTRGLQEDTDCKLRYFQHYEIKGCQVNEVDSFGCPTSYSCPSPTNVSFSDPKVCIYQNVEYQIGDKIELLNEKCKVCRCSGGENPHITCRQRECPQMDPVEGQNCHLVYEENKCCPSRYECVSYAKEINDIERTEMSCMYKDVQYPLGAKIYPSDDVCLVCECTKDWSGVDNSSCHQQECVIERNKHHLDAGCIPVYHENKCCPIEYYCPETLQDSYSLLEISDTPNENASDNGSQCIFGAKSYAIGADIPVNNSCIKCSCQVPPDFTCIHQSCPSPPNAGNCFSSYSDNQCCPIYECLQADESTDNNFTNDSSEAICPTPLCADKSCIIGILPGHECPTCLCDDSREKNDLEPLFQEIEPHYIESENETHTLDNEILSPIMPRNFSEREPSAQVLGDNREPKNAFEYEEMEDPQSAPGLEVAAPKQEESTDYAETESEMEWEGTMPQTSTEVEISTAATSELRQKRSENMESAAIQTSNSQQQWNVFQQDQANEDPEDSNVNSERELEGNNEDFGEMKVFSTKNSNQRSLNELVELDDNELENVIWTSEVDGCPAPMCANSSCRIGIPQGHTCPTCVCKKRKNRQP